MRLVTFRHNGSVSAGLLHGSKVCDLSPLVPGGLDCIDDLIRLGEKTTLVLEQASDALPQWELDEVQLLAPIRRPGKIICVGLNYLDHCRETKTPMPRAPIIFAKWPSAIVGPGDTIELHEDLTTELDWEAELVVVVGTSIGPGRPGSLHSVFGYTIGNDISARDLQREDGQWTRAKSLDTFCPIGPIVVTSDELRDPQNLGIGCNVNGTTHQNSNTNQMIFDISYLIKWVAQGISLDPGDLLFTGTPHGTGAYQDPPIFLGSGDTVTSWITEIGELNNVVQFSSQKYGINPTNTSRATADSGELSHTETGLL